MAVKLCVIPGVCQCAVEELVQRVLCSANLLTEALSGKWTKRFLPFWSHFWHLFPLTLSSLSLSSPPPLLLNNPLDCSLLSSECIDTAAVQFRLLEDLLACYDISTIISKDSKSTYKFEVWTITNIHSSIFIRATADYWRLGGVCFETLWNFPPVPVLCMEAHCLFVLIHFCTLYLMV